MTFFLGVTGAGFFATEEAAIPYELTVRTCVPLDGVETPNDGPGSDVYRARKERIAEIDQELKSLPETYRRIAKRNGGYFCATSYFRAMDSLQRERELLIDLTETAEGSRLAHRDVCYED